MRHADVLDGAIHVCGSLPAKHAGEYFLSGQSGEGEGSDELLRVLRHHDLDVQPFLLQPAHELGGFVRRHATRYSEDDAHG